MIYKRILRSEIKRNVFTQENVIKNHNLKINRCSFGFEKTPNCVAKDAL